MLSKKLVNVFNEHGYEPIFVGILEGRQIHRAIAKKEEVYILKGKDNKFIFLRKKSYSRDLRRYTLLCNGYTIYQKKCSVRDAARDIDAILQEYD